MRRQRETEISYNKERGERGREGEREIIQGPHPSIEKERVIIQAHHPMVYN